ncbi:ABC transporter ATP-binding protein [Paenibacillus senegalensis]|uniref:ABC transporter ATP-binding protein n=1 Tax=Paenibacillus senegalensis TaxID=1465766 RepID=UPI0002896407
MEKTDILIKAENLGVSFISGYRTNDYKSRIQEWLFPPKEQLVRKRIWPVRNVNFNAYQGEIIGIIGSNGSGKTTLCKMIAGILQPDEGSLQVDGRVSVLFSLGLGFNQEMTGRENVYLNGMIMGVDRCKIDKFMDEIHDFSGIGEYFEQPVKYYSSGMRARLGFSVASFLEPEILILDEALNTGDIAFGEKAANKMKSLIQKAKMVIIVTHSLKYALKHCDRLIWMEKGEIKGIGDPKTIIKSYEHFVEEKKLKKRQKGSEKKLELSKVEIRDNKIEGNIVLNMSNAGVSYKLSGGKTFWALKNINLQIHEGEIVGIIGHNGAGKSTLCKLITGILKPDTGACILKGQTTSLLGYGTGFNSELTGRDNVFLNGMLLGISKETIQQHFEDIVRFAELEKAIDKPIKQYSSGMRSRLGFSISAYLQPDIFIIDEALSTGDLSFNQKASNKMQEMIETAKAVLIVSHSMGFVQKVCTRAVWLEKGTIVASGLPSEVVKEYKDKLGKK